MTSSDDQAPERTPEQAPEPGAPQFNPQTAYPSHQEPQPPYGYQAPGQPYGQPQYQQYPPAPYGQPQYGNPQYAQPQYVAPPYYYGPPEHPRANLAFVLGLIGGPGAFATCGLTLLAAPFAWYFAAVVRRDLKAAAPGQYSGDTSKVTAGLVLGIIGSTLLVLAFVLIAIFIVWAIADPSAFDDSTTV